MPLGFTSTPTIAAYWPALVLPEMPTAQSEHALLTGGVQVALPRFTLMKASLPVNGADDIAEHFLQHFGANHRLTVDALSCMDAPVNRCREILSRTDLCIQFSPSIPDDNSLLAVNELLPRSHRNILVSASEISTIVARVPAKRSTGPDRMPYFLFKHFSPAVILFLTIFFNQLLSRAHFPSVWKHSLVTPIPKAGKDASIFSN